MCEEAIEPEGSAHGKPLHAYLDAYIAAGKMGYSCLNGIHGSRKFCSVAHVGSIVMRTANVEQVKAVLFRGVQMVSLGSRICARRTNLESGCHP